MPRALGLLEFGIADTQRIEGNLKVGETGRGKRVSLNCAIFPVRLTGFPVGAPSNSREKAPATWEVNLLCGQFSQP
jgi:hypothetical protein